MLCGGLFLGGIDFGPQSETSGKRRRNWEPLEGSQREMEAIARVWQGPEFVTLTGAKATEARLRQLIPTKRIVHIATHGRFNDESIRDHRTDDERNSRGGFQMAGGRGTIPTRHPMLRSRLVLANANRPPQPVDAKAPWVVE